METQSRDQLVLALRPNLSLPAGKSMEEKFQNEVLRPILKFQNEFIVEIGRSYVQKHFKQFNALKPSVQEGLLRNAGKNDPELRNSLVYSVVSLLTSEEYASYLNHRPEFNKRIANMGVQRIISQLDRLY